MTATNTFPYEYYPQDYIFPDDMSTPFKIKPRPAPSLQELRETLDFVIQQQIAMNAQIAQILSKLQRQFPEEGPNDWLIGCKGEPLNDRNDL